MKKNTRILTSLVLASLFAGTLSICAADLPSYYDWRLTDPTDRTSATTDAVVSPIRDQGHYNTCWSFATMASLESGINLKRQALNLPSIGRLSERYLVWLTFAKPTNGGGDGFYFRDLDPTARDPESGTLAPYDGDLLYQGVSTFVRYGTAYNIDPNAYVEDPSHNVNMAGIASLAGNGTALHDFYGLQLINHSTDPNFNPYATTGINKNIDYYKTMLQQYGVLRLNYHAPESNDKNICNTTYAGLDHAISLVGWDDNYTMTTSDGKTHTGAWLMRNSWGADAGDKGYFYISYDDVATSYATFYNAETDWGRYTAIDTAAPGGWNIMCNVNGTLPWPLAQTGSYKTASKLTSGGSQFLKAVGIFVPADSMSYKIEVSLKGDTPANTTTIYTQSGTFGEDGTAMYKGYRTVDFDKYVYLPSSQKYFVTVTLTGKAGETYVIPVSYEEGKTLARGTSYVFDSKTGAWVDVQDVGVNAQETKSFGTPGTGVSDDNEQGLPLFALSKYSNEANGGDFTVVSLNDNGVGGSKIYLGKKDEPYTTDLLHPILPDYPDTYRYTLSTMTVELTKGLTDSVYGGEISGEGSVTKTGDGMLALSGPNTYTGGTNVKEGSFALTGSLQSPVIVASGATFTGNGTINGNLTSSGTLVPGLTAEARNLFYAASGNSNTTTIPQVGTLTVNGNFISTGNLVVAVNGTNISKLAVGGTSTLTGTSLSLVNGNTDPLVNHQYNYLTSQGGITGNVTTTDVSPYITLNATVNGNNAYVTANQTQTLGSLPGMSPSEKSVGGALTQLTELATTTAPDSTTTATLNSLLYQNEATSRKFIKQVTSEARPQLLNVSPMSALTAETVASRLNTVDYSTFVGTEVRLKSFDGVPATMKVDIPMALDADNELWFKLFRGFEMYGGNSNSPDLNNKSFGGAIGYDRAIPGTTTRVGGLFAYGHTDYEAGTLNGDSHDWRVGIYASHDSGVWKTQGLIAYGRNHYDINRTITSFGDRLNANYSADIFDAAAKVKYLPPQNRLKSVQLAPYATLSYTHTSQDGYSETGGSVFAQNIDSASNNSLRGEVGLELTHNIDKTSSVGGSIGYKRVLSGVNPELNGTFTGDNNRFHIVTDNDKDYVTYSLNVRKNTGNNWTVQGEIRGERSAHNHSEVYSMLAKYAF